ncbi:Protein VAPYRIN-LIKE [Linum grandiflorum]
MDRLVRTEVKEVEILYKKGQKCTASFKVTNLMHTMSVAISLSTTTNPSSSSSLFSFSHPLSIISPLSTVSYAVVLSSSTAVAPPLSAAISVSSAMLPTGKATADDLRRLFSVPGRHVFRDAVVHVSVVGHQVAEWIVSDSYCSKSFEKAVSRCSVNQVNGLLRSAVASGKADFVRILIEKGADLNRRDSGSCLFAAAAANRVDIMQMLSANFGSVDMNSTDSMGRTPIHAAAMNGHEKAIRFISFAGGDSDLADKKGFTPLHLAAEKGGRGEEVFGRRGGGEWKRSERVVAVAQGGVQGEDGECEGVVGERSGGGCGGRRRIYAVALRGGGGAVESGGDVDRTWS